MGMATVSNNMRVSNKMVTAALRQSLLDGLLMTPLIQVLMWWNLIEPPSLGVLSF